jgi:Leucine-rich repeat (LRR) protein/GTPase SAR1 family protein
VTAVARDQAYINAEKKIEEAQRLGATNLSLSGMEITELPESLGQLTQLKALDLRYNKLSPLPESLGQLTQLKALDLSYNQLSSLPESLGQLTQLQALDLSSNQLSSLPESLGQLKQLQALDLSSNQLSSLPESLGQLTKLQDLNLSSNQLSSLPEALGQLTQLQALDLSSNQLSSLPESLGQLTKLQELNLSSNEFSSLPEWLRQLTRLQALFLRSNQLSSLPEWLGQLTKLQALVLRSNQLSSLPEWLGQLTQLQTLVLSSNQLPSLPESLGQLTKLRELDLSSNQLTSLPEALGQLTQLQALDLSSNQLSSLQESLGQLIQLQALNIYDNQISSLPESLRQLTKLQLLYFDDNLLNPELAAASKEGIDAVKRYLRAKAESQVVLNEAKLILVGEGEVGKSCLLGALRGDKWIEGRPTTHGIEIKPVEVINPETATKITLNGWDFGGQPIYRPTHQLFFSAPAVYLVVWKPREGPQGFVKEWIKLIKHREPDAKIYVVATHGGSGQRQPDMDRQELWDLFGRDTVLNFFHVDSKPDEQTGVRQHIAELKDAIAQVAASLPEMGRKVPARWQQAREALQKGGAAYLPLKRVLEICSEHKMDNEEARIFVSISHRLGHLIHYEHDPALQDIVVLKPDWLATAISFVLDDKQTRASQGLVNLARLNQLWNDPEKPAESRYPPKLHPVFLRLMERFDLSYRVAGFLERGHSDETSLIAQLVPDVRPDEIPEWSDNALAGDEQQVQICKIVDAQNGQSATAAGLFYQLIVRLHKFSLGREDHRQSVHWQRGLVLDDFYNGRALLEHIGNDVRITVRAPYPERFLSVLTSEVKWLVESFWAGLRCNVMVPCLEPCGKGAPGNGLFEVQKLIESKRQLRKEYPCPLCDEWQRVDALLRNAPSVQRMPADKLQAGFAEVRDELSGVRALLIKQHGEAVGRFDILDTRTQRILSQVDDAFTNLLQTLTDEVKEGPRLFSFQPLDPGFFDRPKWVNQKFRLTLWCEHSRLPLPALNGKGDPRGIYELNLPREWFVKAAPFLKVLTGTLSLVLPVASSATKLIMDDASYKGIEKELDLGQKSIDSVIKGGEKVKDWLARRDTSGLEQGEAIKAQGAVLRQLHVFLKKKNPGFGGLVRVQNKRQEFLWVHEQFEKEY